MKTAKCQHCGKTYTYPDGETICYYCAKSLKKTRWGWYIAVMVVLTLIWRSCQGGGATGPTYPYDTSADEQQAEAQEYAEGQAEFRPDPADLYPTPWSEPVEPTRSSALDDGCVSGDENSTNEAGMIVRDLAADMEISRPYTWRLCWLADNPTYEEFKQGITAALAEYAYTLVNDANDGDVFYLQYLGDKIIDVVYTSEKDGYPVTALTITHERAYVQSRSQAIGCAGGCETYVAGCEIKGNISVDSGEKIYHMQGQKYYANTRINPEYGERWFCEETEAQAAGWRKSQQ